MVDGVSALDCAAMAVFLTIASRSRVTERSIASLVKRAAREAGVAESDLYAATMAQIRGLS